MDAGDLGSRTGPQAGCGAGSWARWYERAALALRRRLEAEGELSPREAAELVAASLPAQTGRRLLDRLTRSGWLEPGARIPVDLLDRLPPGADLPGAQRELARLALFGAGAQGIPAEAKHREAVFQQLCGQIMRETRDLDSLAQAAARALGHPEVQRDPILNGMVSSFLAEREADFKMRRREQHPAGDAVSRLASAFGPTVRDREAAKAHFQGTFQRLQHEFEDQAAQFEEAAAQAALSQMRQMQRAHPEYADRSVIDACEAKYARLVARCDVYRRQIEELAGQAVEAARRGDQKTASWTLRRMSAIHALRPMLLPAARFELLRERIVRAGAEHDQQEAAQALAARERAVAAEIKRLGEIVDRYHQAVHRLAPDEPRFLRIAAQYRRAVAEIRARDTEWLAELMIELDGLVADLADGSGRADTQVGRFIASVRAALLRLRKEVQTIQREQAQRRPGR